MVSAFPTPISIAVAAGLPLVGTAKSGSILPGLVKKLMGVLRRDPMKLGKYFAKIGNNLHTT
ncbi:hypothetical protein [Microcoleus sp. CAWBG640]|uniref:hypothetical protein n=1 Tax=Microcoleus sp. CAWBG640 TaxID=2841653 RepID=UPI00312B3D67